MLFLDRGLGASKRPAVETQVAKAETPTPPSAPTSAQPVADTAPIATTAAATQFRPRQFYGDRSLSGTSTSRYGLCLLPANPQRPPARRQRRFASPPDWFSLTSWSPTTRGRPVKDLNASDFQVQQDGKQQSVVAFESHALTVDVAANAASPANSVDSEWQASEHLQQHSDASSAEQLDHRPLRSAEHCDRRPGVRAQSVAATVESRCRKDSRSRCSCSPASSRCCRALRQDPEQLLRRAELLQPSKSQDLTTLVERERETGRIVSTAQQAAPTSRVGAECVLQRRFGCLLRKPSRILQNYNDHEAFRTTDRALFTLEAMKGMARAVSGYPGRKNLVWLSGSFPVEIEPDPASTDPFRNVRSFEERHSRQPRRCWPPRAWRCIRWTCADCSRRVSTSRMAIVRDAVHERCGPEQHQWSSCDVDQQSRAIPSPRRPSPSSTTGSR